MKERNYLTKATTLLGAVALTSAIALPALAVSPRPSNANELNSNLNSQTILSQGQTATVLSALDREFIMMAAQGNNAEIQTSQLALQKSQSQEVRSFAQQMIQEHTLANQRLSQVASRYGMTLPSDPGPLNAAIAEQLAQLSGEAFDRAYMETQENAHMRAIALYRTAISQGKTPEVQSYASELLPNVTRHFEMARNMTPQERAQEPARPHH